MLTPEKIQALRTKIRALSNSARYDEAYALAKGLSKSHPNVFIFSYWEALYSAERESGFSQAQIKARHRLAAKKLRRLLYRLRATDEVALRFAVRNEYYWFSHQPYKQYLMGLERVAQKAPRAHYPVGVGAAELAKQYALKGRKGLAIRWAKRSEKAWLSFFKDDSRWYNSYFFYATSLAIQGRARDAERALERARKIARKSKKWAEISDWRRAMEPVFEAMEKG